MNNGKNSPLVVLTTPTTKMLAIGRWTAKGMDPTTRVSIMVKEVPAIVRLFLQAK